jgi:CDP-paratose 2-epimerase
MSIAIVTGSAGLIGAEASRFFTDKGLDVVGIDNDMRRLFFGDDASTCWSRAALEADLPRYHHIDTDIRNQAVITNVFSQYSRDIAVVIHSAAQPSHDWATVAISD